MPGKPHGICGKAFFTNQTMTKNSWVRNVLPWLGIAAAIILLDQITKFWILQMFQLGDARPVTSFFNIVRAHNLGAAFNFLAGASGWQREFFIGIGAVASIFIVYLLGKHGHQKLFALALAGIMGGALGNVIDRLQHGYVVDFLDIHVGGWHWPAFNVADSAIVGGAMLLVLDEILRVRRAK
jgi:signal peptidase II